MYHVDVGSTQTVLVAGMVRAAPPSVASAEVHVQAPLAPVILRPVSVRMVARTGISLKGVMFT